MYEQIIPIILSDGFVTPVKIVTVTKLCGLFTTKELLCLYIFLNIPFVLALSRSAHKITSFCLF